MAGLDAPALAAGGAAVDTAAAPAFIGDGEGGSPVLSRLRDRALAVDGDGRVYEDCYMTLVEDLVVTPAMYAPASAPASAAPGSGSSGGGGSGAGAAGGTASASGGDGASGAASGGMAEWHCVLRVLKRLREARALEYRGEFTTETQTNVGVDCIFFLPWAGA